MVEQVCNCFRISTAPCDTQMFFKETADIGGYGRERDHRSPFSIVGHARRAMVEQVCNRGNGIGRNCERSIDRTFHPISRCFQFAGTFAYTIDYTPETPARIEGANNAAYSQLRGRAGRYLSAPSATRASLTAAGGIFVGGATDA
jgi:hypothetical protein